jgi:small-conductance mechanosensitive channel
VLVNEVLTDSFLRFLGRFVLIPIAGLNVLGLLGPLNDFLNGFVVQTGNISFSAMTLVRGVIAGSLLFWLGTWSNSQTATYIGRQPMRPAIRQLSLKAAEIAIFGLAFLMLLNVMGISVSSLTILGGALGVGLGFGLQKIASNFASGVILLIEGQTTVGDRVRLNGGEEGRIIKMTARATILETDDGSWIMVPNEDFITTRVINYSDAGPQMRHEAAFAVPYGTDLARVPPIVVAALAGHPDVLHEAPHGPGCELRAFAEGGVRFVAEFWVEGEREGTHYTSDALFLIWAALAREGIDVVGTVA